MAATIVGTPGAIRAVPASAGHLGQGITYPLAYDSKGRLALSSGVQSVNDSLKSIILTVPGERVMQPDYGANILPFEPLGEVSRFRVELDRNIREHEPRIRDFTLSVKPDPSQAGVVIVQIEYYTSDEASPQTLTYPYFLGANS